MKESSLLAWQIAWFNKSTWLDRLWRRSWWEYVADKSTLTDADGGDAEVTTNKPH